MVLNITQAATPIGISVLGLALPYTVLNMSIRGPKATKGPTTPHVYLRSGLPTPLRMQSLMIVGGLKQVVPNTLQKIDRACLIGFTELNSSSSTYLGQPTLRTLNCEKGQWMWHRPEVHPARSSHDEESRDGKDEGSDGGHPHDELSRSLHHSFE
ncbi:hypothetical protein Fot_19799 [Forsythia ovata]|uniref:Uncharacterized protein n=1 Tax=Forsythia ovata TaxID=205694 RepID=A0ABD1VM69_9LAMI